MFPCALSQTRLSPAFLTVENIQFNIPNLENGDSQWHIIIMSPIDHFLNTPTEANNDSAEQYCKLIDGHG